MVGDRRKCQRDKKFPFKPSLTLQTQRLAQRSASIDPGSEGKRLKRWEELYKEDRVRRERLSQNVSMLTDKRHSVEVEGCTS